MTSSTDSWECASCTFLNSNSSASCAVCESGRDATTLSDPIEWVCQNCTFLNSSSHSSSCEPCELCGFAPISASDPYEEKDLKLKVQEPSSPLSTDAIRSPILTKVKLEPPGVGRTTPEPNDEVHWLAADAAQAFIGATDVHGLCGVVEATIGPEFSLATVLTKPQVDSNFSHRLLNMRGSLEHLSIMLCHRSGNH